MADQADEFSVGPGNEGKRAGEDRDPRPLKRKRPLAPKPVPEEGECDPYLECFAKPQGDGTVMVSADATASRDAHEEMVASGSPTFEGFLSTSMAACSVPLYPLASPADDSTGPREAGLLLEAGGDPLGAAIASGGPSAPGPDVPLLPMVEVVPDPFPQSFEEINAGIKHQLMKEVRQFGRKYERIFKLLEQVRGSAEVKKQIVAFTIKEAARFKRRDLIKQLEKVLEKTGSDN